MQCNKYTSTLPFVLGMLKISPAGRAFRSLYKPYGKLFGAKSLARHALRSRSSELKALRGVLCGAALRSQKPCEACSAELFKGPVGLSTSHKACSSEQWSKLGNSKE